jgi:hypothetical protein
MLGGVVDGDSCWEPDGHRDPDGRILAPVSDPFPILQE